MDSFIASLRSLSIFIRAILKSLPCALSTSNFSGPALVGLLGSGGNTVLVVTGCVFRLESRHLGLG